MTDIVNLKMAIESAEATANVREFERSFKDAMKGLEQSDKEIRAFRTLAADVRQGKVEIDALDAEMQKLVKTFNESRQVAADRDFLGIKPHAAVREEIERTRAAYERLKASGKLSMEEQAQAALKTEERIQQLDRSTNGWAESLVNARVALAQAGAAGAGLAVLVGQAIDFESAMGNVAKVVDASDEQLAGLAERIKDLSTELPISAEGLAQIAAAGGQLGVPIEKLDQFILLAAKMATAFDISAEQAGEAVAKLTNVFGLGLNQVEALGDAINVLGNTTAAREKDIVEVLTRIGGSSKQFGLAAEQAAALGAAMLSLGKSPEVAATGINALLTKLQTGEVQSAAFKNTLKALGTSAEQLAADIRNNPQKALDTFLGTLESINPAERSKVLAQLFGTEYQDDVAALVGSLAQYREALAKVGDGAGIAGAMTDEFKKRLQSSAAQLDLLKNSANTAAINIGTVFLPTLNAIASALATGSSALAAFAEQFPAITFVATSLVVVTAAAGALRLALASLGVVGAKSFGGLRGEIALLQTSVTGVTAKVGLLGAALRGVGVAAVAFDIGTWVGEWALQFEVVRQAGVALAAGLTRAFEQIRYAWEVVKAAFDDGTIEEATARHLARLQEIDDSYAQIFADASDENRALAESSKQAASAAKEQADATKEVTAAAEGGATGVSDLVKAYETLGITSQAELKKTADAAHDAFEVIFMQSESLKDTEAAWLKYAEVALRASGGVVTEQMRAEAATLGLTKRLDEMAVAAGGTEPAVDELAAAFKTLGITSQTELQKAAGAARKAYETIKQSGVSLDDQKRAWLAYAEAAIKANDGVATASLRAEAGALGLTAQLQQLEKTASPLSAAMQALAKSYDEQTKAAERETAATQQQVAGRVQAAQAALELAKAEGDAVEIRRAEIAVAEAQAEAALELAEAKQVEADVTWAKVSALEAEARADGQVTAAEQESIAVAKEAAAAKQLAADQAREHAEAELQRAKALKAVAAEMFSLTASAEQIAEQMGVAAEYADKFGKRLYELAQNSQSASRQMNALRAEAARYAESLAEVDEVLQQVEDGQMGLAELANYNIDRFWRLGEEDLRPLRDAIEDAKNRLEEMGATAAEKLMSLREELAELEGREADAEQMRQERRIRELESLLAEARAAGNRDAVRSYEDALRVLEDINRRRTRDANARQSGQSEPASLSRINEQRQSGMQGPQGGQVLGAMRLVKIDVTGLGAFRVPESDEQLAERVFRKLEEMARVSARRS